MSEEQLKEYDYLLCNNCSKQNKPHTNFCEYCGSKELTEVINGKKKRERKRKKKTAETLLKPKGLRLPICFVFNGLYVILIIVFVLRLINDYPLKGPVMVSLLVLVLTMGLIDTIYLIIFLVELVKKRSE